MNKYIKLLKDTFIYAIGGIGSKLILFFLVPLYTNYLSTEQYGIADLIFTISQFIIPFASVVIWGAVVRFALSKNEKKEDVLLCSLIVWIVGSIVMVFITPIIGLYEPIDDWKWYLCVYVIVNIFMSIELNYIKAKEQNKLYATISIVQTLTMALSNVLFIVVIPLGIGGYVIANIVGNSIAALCILFLGKICRDIKKATFSSELLKKMLIYSAPLVLNDVSWWAIHSANKIIVELALGASILGIYTVATKIPALINVLISIFQQSWGISSIKEIETSNDSRFYSNIFRMFSFISFGMGIGLIFIIKPLMAVYVGESFVDAWIYIPLLLASATFSAISSYFVSLYAALKKSLNNMITTFIGAVVNVAVSVILVNHIDLWGAIVGTFVAYFVLGIIRMVDATRFIKIKIGIWRFVANSIILIVEAILVSLQIQIYLVSAISIILFVTVNWETVIELWNNLKKIKKVKNEKYL